MFNESELMRTEQDGQEDITELRSSERLNPKQKDPFTGNDLLVNKSSAAVKPTDTGLTSDSTRQK